MAKGNTDPIPLPLSNKLLRFPLKKMRAGNIDARVKRRSKGIFNRGRAQRKRRGILFTRRLSEKRACNEKCAAPAAKGKEVLPMYKSDLRKLA